MEQKGIFMLKTKPFLKLVVFDFDKTLTTRHLYHIIHNYIKDVGYLSQRELIDIFGGQKRIDALNNMLLNLKENGSELYIMSFGVVSYMKKALHRVGISPDIFTHIYGQDTFGGIYNKSEKILQLKREKKISGNNILFVDDDKQNIDQAVKVCKTILLVPYYILDENVMNVIINMNKGIEPVIK